MKLIIAIVQENDASRLVKALVDSNFQATKLATTGGFLKKGNTTLMIGCQKNHVIKVLDLIKEHCSNRKKATLSDYPMRANVDLYTMSPIEIGGATVFVLPIESFQQF